MTSSFSTFDVKGKSEIPKGTKVQPRIFLGGGAVLARCTKGRDEPNLLPSANLHSHVCDGIAQMTQGL